MSVSFFRNDKGTIKDEIILSIILAIVLAIGIALIAYGDSLWVFGRPTVVTSGVMCIVFVVMMLPSVIYRFIEDTKAKKTRNNEDNRE